MNKDKPSIGQYFGYLKEKRSLWLIAAALILGVCLMVLGGRSDSSRSVAVSVTHSGTTDLEELEARVEGLCERVIGVGDASVMITLDTLGEQLYAVDLQTRQEGERREANAEYVTVSQGLVPTGEVMPRIRGIAVVCSGGDDVQIKLKLTELLCALFDISSSAVSIVGGN